MADVFEYLPWSVADRLFRPGDDDSSGMVARVSTARSVLGFLLVAYFSLANGVWPLDEFAIARTAAAAAFAAAGWVCLLLVASRRPLPQSLKEDCWRVLRRVLALFVSVAIGSVLMAIPIVGLVAALWLYWFTFWAFWLICRYQFGAGDARRLLTPLVTVTIAALLAVYNLTTVHTEKIPPRLDELIVVSGVGTTALVALWEFLVLRHRGERFSTEPAEAAAAGWAPSPAPVGHKASGPADGLQPWAGQRSYRRRRPRSTAKRLAVIVAALVALPLLWLAARGIGKGEAGHPATSQPPGTAALGSPANPARGTLVIRPNHDYILAVGSPYPIARTGGADVGHLTGTPSGVDVAEAWALPLPRGTRGGYQPCLALNWTGTQVWSAGHVIPWTALRPGRQICVQTTYSGLYISLLTVSRRPARKQVAFRVETWSCNPRPDESAIC